MTAAIADASEDALRVSQSEIEGPYVGLRTYEETDANRYFGREDSVAELARMVKRASLTVLFGVSGTGKSSMIRAGLFPIVRAEQHLPILIRLDFTSEQRDLRAQVRDAIARELDKQEVDGARPVEGVSLREYFAHNPWWTKRNRLLTPFIVFDQFEEIFTVGRDHSEQVAVLMDELAEMVEHPMLEDVQVDIVAPRPRLMLALREDFLAHLEDYRVRMPSLIGNRYRLTRMNGGQALRAVLHPAGDIVDEVTAKKIVRFVAGGADSTDAVDAPELEEDRKHPLDTLEVEPAILSLVCEQLDIRRRKQALPAITVELLKTQGEQIVEGFYDNAFEKLPGKVRVLIEDRLVTNDGFRTTMAKDAAYEFPGVTEQSIKALLDRKILREEVRFGSLHIELIHDRLAAFASDSRARRRELEREKAAAQREAEREQARQRRWRRKLWYVLGGLATLLAIAVAIAIALVIRTRNRAAKENAATVANRLATFLVREGRDSLLRGDAAHAADRLREASTYFKPDKTPPDLNVLFKRALVELIGRVQTFDHGSDIECLAISGTDGLVTCGRDGSLRLWRDQQIAIDFSSDTSGPPIAASYPNRSGDWVLVLRADGSGELRDHSKEALLAFEGPTIVGQKTAQKAPDAPPLIHGDPLPSVIAAAAVSRAAAPSRRATAAPSTAAEAARATPEPKPAAAGASMQWQGCVAPDDSTIAVWSRGFSGVRLWDAQRKVRVISEWLSDAKPRDVLCLAAGKLLVTTETWPEPFIAGMFVVEADGRANPIVIPKTQRVTRLAITDDGSRVAYAYDGTSGFGVALRNVKDAWAEPRSITSPYPDDMVFSADGDLLMITSRRSDNRVFVGIWSTHDRTLQFAVERPAAVARLVAGRPSQPTSIFVASGKRVEAWETESWQFLGSASFDFELDSALVEAKPAYGSTYLVAAASKNTASLRALQLPPGWSDQQLTRPNEELTRWAPHDMTILPLDWQDSVKALRLVRDQRFVYLREQNGTERGRQTNQGTIIDARITAAGPDASARRIAVLRSDGVVTLYDDRFSAPKKVETAPVRAIRWSAHQELVTIGWSQTQIWSAYGTLAATIPATGQDARLVYAPQRALWLCDGSVCTAWDVKTQRRLARARFEGADTVELDQKSLVPIAVLSSGVNPSAQRMDPVLLPVARATSERVLEPGPITQLLAIGSTVVASVEGSGSYLLQGSSSQPVGTAMLPVLDGKTLIAANGSSLTSGSLDAYAGGSATTGWSAAAPIQAARSRGNRVGVIDAALGLTLLDASKLAAAPRDAVIDSLQPKDLQATGKQAVFSPLGDRYAIVSDAGTIDVRSVHDSKVVSYELGAGAGQHVRAVLLPTGTSLTLAALTETSLVLWTAPGKPTDSKLAPYRHALLDGPGTNLVALRSDNHAEVYRITAGKLAPAKVIPAVSIAIDEKGSRVAIGTPKGDVDIYQLVDLSSSKNDHPFKRPQTKIVFSPPDGKYMWLPVERQFVRTYEQKGDVPVKVQTALDCVFSGDDEQAACVFNEKDGAFVQYVEVSTGKRIGRGYALPRAPERVIPCSTRDTSRVGLALVIGDAATMLTWSTKEASSDPRTFQTRNVVACSVANQAVWTLSDAGTLDETNPQTMVTTVRGRSTLVDVIITADGGMHAAIASPDRIAIKTLPKTRKSRTSIPYSTHAIFINDTEIAGVVPDGKAGELRIWPIVGGDGRTLERAKNSTATTVLAVVGAKQMITAGHEDGAVELWTPGVAKLHAVFPGHGSAASSMTIDDAGTWLAIAYADGTVTVWPLEVDRATKQREPLIRLDARGRAPGAPAIRFVPGSPAPALLTGNADGEIRRWTLSGELPANTSQLINRALAESQFGVR